MSDALSRSLLINTLWSFLGRFGYLAIGLASNIVLARLLSPKEFGQVAIMMFFIVIATVLAESGLSGALVRKKEATEIDYSTIFIFNLIVSLVLMLLLIFTSDYIAEYYNDPELNNILIASSFVLLINSLRITQNTKLIKNLEFKKKSIYEFIAILIGSAVAVILAIKGAGVWALIALQLTTAIVLTGLLWFFVGPLKSYKFSQKSFKQFYKFGINTTLASLLNTAFDNIYQLILGKYFSISQAGYFYQAKKLQEMPIGILQTIMQSVVYSTLSKIQDEPEKFNTLYRNIAKTFTVIVAFICMIIFYYAEFIISILYGDKWIASVPYLQLLTLASFFYIQEMFNRIIFKIFDKTEKILQLEVFKKFIQSFSIIYGVWLMSIEALLYGFIISSMISFLVNYYFAKQVQGSSDWSDFITIIKTIFISITVVLLIEAITRKYMIQDFTSLWMFPLILILYIYLLHIFHVIDLKKDLTNLLLILSKRKQIH